MSLDELPVVLTIEEAAAVLRIGRTAAYELTRRYRASGGKAGLPVLTVGRQLRVPRAALARMLGLEDSDPKWAA
ncbi:MAG TPA: helix-turn-helix domain-containing protein [Acidimicrobiales bacterium]|nr:helix-turn-helix domain-containing protein [Acidimicrobiales bacterium]